MNSMMLAVLLLWVGIGEAGEYEDIVRKRQYHIVPETHDILVTCNEKNMKCWTPCEIRMREVMKAVTPLLPEVKGTSKSGAVLYRQLEPELRVPIIFEAMKQWNATMKECVQ